MSLDRSARRRERENQQLIAQSPTMKRLIGSKTNSARTVTMSTVARESDIFKVPVVPTKKKQTDVESTNPDPAGAQECTTNMTMASGTGRPHQPPRKQERPKPLARAASLTNSSKSLFNRREVSLSRRSSGLGLKKKGHSESKDALLVQQKDKEPHRRKSTSPRSESWQVLDSSEQIVADPTAATEMSSKHFLVPDTPDNKPALNHPIARASSMLSFAALGAAFRPGSADTSASIPMFSLDTDTAHRAQHQEGMDWSAEEDEEEFFLQGLEEEAKKRKERERVAPNTPVTRKRSLIVPDT